MTSFVFCSEDQQFLNEIVTSVLNANGVGMFKKKRLRELMANEICRQKVVNKLLFEMSDEKKTEVVCDVVSVKSNTVSPFFETKLPLILVKNTIASFLTFEAQISPHFPNKTLTVPYRTVPDRTGPDRTGRDGTILNTSERS